MARVAVLLMTALLALPLALAATAALLGAGLLRRGPTALVAAAAAALVLLPALALSLAARRHRVPALLGALATWSMGVLAAFPLYFPGERAQALSTGFTVLGGTAGPTLGVRLDRLLPAAEGARPPAPRARPVDDEPAAPATLSAPAGAVLLPLGGAGESLIVTARLEGPRGEAIEAPMLLDTGATLTTLPARSLLRLGVEPAPDAPLVPLKTASGSLEARVTLLDRLSLGTLSLAGVTVAECESCADGEVVGLLGLNVLGLFQVTLDHGARRVVLVPRAGGRDRTLDVSPWLHVRASATVWPDGQVEVELRARNGSPRSVPLAELGVRCDTWYSALLRDLSPRGEGATTISLPMGTSCDQAEVRLRRAEW